MYVKNIREIKKGLRAKSRQFRERLDPQRKADMDAAIQSRFFSLREFGAADVILTYVSKEIEVDTLETIRAVLAQGKRVAVPRCVPDTFQMEFFEIDALQELEKGMFGVLEPVPSRSRPLAGDERCLCVVPGLSFDSQGFRLGYGKGYYDRFLTNFQGPTVGLCYSGCVRWNLPHGFYDRPVDVLITEKYIRRISGRPL
jgi:5-formyltetrahydrofolate cyclo-ligase